MAKKEKPNQENTPWALDLLRKNSISLALLACSSLIALLNTYAFVKLAPLMQSIGLLDTRVHAIEQRNTKADQIIDKYLPVIISIESIKEDITEMKKDVSDLRTYVLGRR